MSIIIQTPETNRWAECIGGLVINFGLAECLSFIWIRKLAGKDAERKARKKTFGERIERITKLISTSQFSNQDKESAIALWGEIKRHSGIRNRIAHNPVNFAIRLNTGETFLTIHDLKKASAVDHDHIEELKIDKIRDTAIRIGQINFALDDLIEPHPLKL